MKEKFCFRTRFKKNRSRTTVIAILNEDKTVLKFGMAKCNKNDQFNKVLGNTIALGRAQKSPILEVPVPKDEKITKLFLDKAKELINISKINLKISNQN